VYAVGYDYEEPLRARLLLIQPDGSVEQVPTEGIWGGDLTLADGRLHVSDQWAEIRIGSDAVQRVERGRQEFLTEWSGATSRGAVQVFNAGTHGTDDYHYAISAWRSDDVVEGHFTGDPRGFAACGEDLVGLIDDWPRGGRDGMELVRFDIGPSDVRAQIIAPVEHPYGRMTPEGLYCADGAPVVVASTSVKRERLLVTGTLADEMVRWQETAAPQPRIYAVLGLRDRALWYQDDAHGVWEIDLDTAVVRERYRADDAVAYIAAGLDDDDLVVWEEREDGDRILRRVSADGTVGSLRLDGVRGLLDDQRLQIGSAPVVLSWKNAFERQG